MFYKNCHSQNISQKQLAFETGLTRESVNRIENCEIKISLHNMIKIDNALSIPPKNLIDF